MLAIKTDLGTGVTATHRILRLVAIGERAFHAKDILDRRVTQPGLLQCALHQCLLELELGRIGQRTYLTATTLGVGAEIGNPIGRGLEQLGNLAVQIVRLDLGQLHQRLLTGQQTFDKQGAIEQASFAISFVGQFQDLDLVLMSH